MLAGCLPALLFPFYSQCAPQWPLGNIVQGTFQFTPSSINQADDAVERNYQKICMDADLGWSDSGPTLSAIRGTCQLSNNWFVQVQRLQTSKMPSATLEIVPATENNPPPKMATSWIGRFKSWFSLGKSEAASSTVSDGSNETPPSTNAVSSSPEALKNFFNLGIGRRTQVAPGHLIGFGVATTLESFSKLPICHQVTFDYLQENFGLAATFLAPLKQSLLPNLETVDLKRLKVEFSPCIILKNRLFKNVVVGVDFEDCSLAAFSTGKLMIRANTRCFSFLGLHLNAGVCRQSNGPFKIKRELKRWTLQLSISNYKPPIHSFRTPSEAKLAKFKPFLMASEEIIVNLQNNHTPVSNGLIYRLKEKCWDPCVREIRFCKWLYNLWD